MLSFTSKIFDIFKTITFILGIITLIIALIFWWKRNRRRKGLSANEYFSDADTTHLTSEDLQELNDEKEMMF